MSNINVDKEFEYMSSVQRGMHGLVLQTVKDLSTKEEIVNFLEQALGYLNSVNFQTNLDTSKMIQAEDLSQMKTMVTNYENYYNGLANISRQAYDNIKAEPVQVEPSQNAALFH